MSFKTTLFAATAATALILGAHSASAAIQVNQPGDGNMSCAQLSQEIASMDEVISTAESKKTGSKVASAGFGLLQSVVPHFGGGAGAVMGTLHATNAASGIAGMTAANAEEMADQAQMRRVALMGIHTGKGCAAAATEPAAGTPEKKEAAPEAIKWNSGGND